MNLCETCGRRSICRYKRTDSAIECAECGLYEKAGRTNFNRITASEEALAEFIDQVSTECYVCGRNRMNMECQQEPCSAKVRYCTREFIDWLKQESTE